MKEWFIVGGGILSVNGDSFTFQQIGIIITAMTHPSQALHDSKQIVMPLRLIFWGSIVVFAMLKIDSNFDISNDFVGMMMIAIMFVWMVIHILMSLSRMIYAAQEQSLDKSK